MKKATLLVAVSGIILLGLAAHRPHISGEVVPTEEIIKKIISGSKVSGETPTLPGGENPDTQQKPIEKATADSPIAADDEKKNAAASKNKSIKESGTADEALFKTGVEFYHAELFDAAVKSFSELKDKHPQSSNLHSAMIYSARARMRLRDYKKAAEDLKAVPAESGEYPAALFYRAETQYGLGKRTDAVSLFYQAASQYPQTPLADDSLIRASQILLEEQKGPQALEAAVRVVRYYGDRETVDDAYFMIGQIYERDPALRDVEISRKVYRVFIRKAEAGEKHFKDSPLLRRVKRELTSLEKRYFKYER